MSLLGYCKSAPKIKGEGKILGDLQIVFKKGETVKLECDEGYTAAGGVVEATCNGKKFSPKKFKCEKRKFVYYFVGWFFNLLY